MTRLDEVNKVYQRGNTLNFNNISYAKRAKSFIEQKISEDIGTGDISALSVVDENQVVQALIKSKSSGIISGISEIEWMYESFGVHAQSYVKEGDHLAKGDSIMLLNGNARKILSLERTGLNILRRMSGIATMTKDYADELVGTNTYIAATRKTTMDEYLEKKAVYTGGGLTHRLGLDDFIMIKDRHIDVLKSAGICNPITSAIERACKSDYNEIIEVEVASYDEALEAAIGFNRYMDRKNLSVIMFDNMKPNEIARTLSQFKMMGIHNQMLYEASGGIGMANLLDYARTGVDVISTSRLTEKAETLDLHQKIIV